MYALCYINIHLHKQGELFGHNHLCHTVNIAMPHPPPPPNHPTSWWGEGGIPRELNPGQQHIALPLVLMVEVRLGPRHASSLLL
jgi:hypothetical protein